MVVVVVLCWIHSFSINTSLQRNSMRPRVELENVAGEVWPGGYDLTPHKTSKKLVSVLDIIGTGHSQVSALSCHGSYLATVTHEPGANLVFIVSVSNNKFYLLKRMVEQCTALVFHPHQETQLFLASASCKVYSINVEDGSVVVMQGHKLPVVGVDAGLRSPVVLTFNPQEVLLWSWPSMVLTNRLRQQEPLPVVWAGHVWQRDELVVAYSCGSVLLWPGRKPTTEVHIKPPEGLVLECRAFAASRGGEWLVGGGQSHLLVTYSLTSRCVAQVVQLPSSCTDVARCFFLPAICPNYPQVLAVLTSRGVLNVIDFTNTTKLKTLRAQWHLIDSVSVSECSGFLGVTYDNSTTKVYPLRALLPATAPGEVQPAVVAKEEVAFQIVEERKKEKQQEEKDEERKKAALKNVQELLDKNKWCRILLEFGSFPDKYRRVIWASVLELPRNYSVFSALLDKGTHPAYQDLEETLQLSDTGLFKALQRTLSCLAHWAPFLAKVSYLPEFVFPFIKVYRTNPLLAFEVSATVILNWCRLWFEFWPSVGVTVLNMVEQLVCEADSTLLAHLMRLRVTAKCYAWPLLTSAFSRVVSSSDWLVLWDHLLASPPSLLPCVAAAFTLASRHSLLSCTEAKEVELYYQQESWVSVRKVVEQAYDLHQHKKKVHSLDKVFGTFTPLPSGGLPLFNIAPRPASSAAVQDENRLHALRSPSTTTATTTTTTTPRHASPHPSLSSFKPEHPHQQKQEEMVYVIGQQELQQQEEQCLDSIMRLRQRHLATAMT
ncbi:TBC1 domain family member 31-like isoform X2 [Portunus trituberculatus]|uniref:TBC1 domain family member 31-like isoform X2 n=1 Tax=Portunus trituberculatus TaxID=210409 RepID=UPI001E1CEE88|nr:TBC1 domain family member 31-like isoform X2 [Portunus trituberculatus]